VRLPFFFIITRFISLFYFIFFSLTFGFLLLCLRRATRNTWEHRFEWFSNGSGLFSLTHVLLFFLLLFFKMDGINGRWQQDKKKKREHNEKRKRFDKTQKANQTQTRWNIKLWLFLYIASFFLLSLLSNTWPVYCYL